MIDLHFGNGTWKTLERTGLEKESDWKPRHKLAAHRWLWEQWREDQFNIQFSQERMRALLKEESTGMERREWI